MMSGITNIASYDNSWGAQALEIRLYDHNSPQQNIPEDSHSWSSDLIPAREIWILNKDTIFTIADWPELLLHNKQTRSEGIKVKFRRSRRREGGLKKTRPLKKTDFLDYAYWMCAQSFYRNNGSTCLHQ